MPRRTRRMLRLRVSLQGSDPEIWRTIDVAEHLPLGRLHDVVQVAFGWQNSHVHKFSEDDPHAASRGLPRIGRRPRVWVDEWSLLDGDDDDEDEAGTTVGEALLAGGPIWYQYDFGDAWTHRIELVDRDAARPGEQVAAIVAGERRGPFENSGGVGGYEEILGILADARHPDHQRTRSWATDVAGPWGSLDPDDADLDAARAELAGLIDPVPYDMSALVDESRGVTPESPIALLAAELDVPARTNLRRHLGRTGLLDPAELDGAASAELMRAYTWLLGAIGIDGLPLSKAGWMAPAVVAQGLEVLDWWRPWMGTSKRENSMPSIRNLRESAQHLGLIRKYGGRLELVARARPLADDPSALCAEVARVLLRQRMDDAHATASTVFVLGLADGSISTYNDAETAVMDVMDELGYQGPDARPMPREWFHELTSPARRVLSAAGLWPIHGDLDPPPSDALRLFARTALR